MNTSFHIPGPPGHAFRGFGLCNPPYIWSEPDPGSNGTRLLWRGASIWTMADMLRMLGLDWTRMVITEKRVQSTLPERKKMTSKYKCSKIPICNSDMIILYDAFLLDPSSRRRPSLPGAQHIGRG